MAAKIKTRRQMFVEHYVENEIKSGRIDKRDRCEIASTKRVARVMWTNGGEAGDKFAADRPNWILCKDMMPEDSPLCIKEVVSIECLVVYNDGTIVIEERYKYRDYPWEWWSVDDDVVTAWMPMPKFNKEDYDV